MFIGFFLSLVVFGTLAYFLTRGVLGHAYQSERLLLGALFLFLALLIGLTLGSFALMAAGSMLGMSLTLGVEALVSSTTNAQPGLVTAIGALLIAVLNLVSIFIGPAGAFVTAKVAGFAALITGLTKLDEKLCLTWMPIAVAVLATWFMWPFTACLTLGL